MYVINMIFKYETDFGTCSNELLTMHGKKVFRAHCQHGKSKLLINIWVSVQLKCCNAVIHYQYQLNGNV